MKPRNFNFGFAILICAVATVTTLSSCKDTITSVTPLDQIVFPSTGISYSKQVQPLFNVGCALPECHDNVTKKANLDLTSYAGLVSDEGIVVAGNPTNSRLIWCIEAIPNYPLMPPAKPLSQNQIQGLKQWILEGANGNN